MDPTSKKYLTLLPGISRTTCTDPVIFALDTFFHERPAHVSSIYRSPQHQLTLIRDFATQKGLVSKYPEAMTCDLDDRDAQGHYVWQWLWSDLLHSGIIINPPLNAHVLLDYFRDGVNKRGELIPQSTHTMGIAFDISGRYNDENILNDIIQIMAKVFYKQIGIKSTTIEHQNDCFHVTCLCEGKI